MESRDHAFMIAGRLVELCRELGLGLVYKSSFDKANRTSLSAERGIGLEKAMEVLCRHQEGIRHPRLDRHSHRRTMRRRRADGRCPADPGLPLPSDRSLGRRRQDRRVVNVKKGQFLAPWDMKNVLNKLNASGNPNVLLCERGASFGYNTLVSDMRSLPIMAAMGAPVVFDATHSVQQPGGQGGSSGGQREFVETLPVQRSPLALAVSLSRPTRIRTTRRPMVRTWFRSTTCAVCSKKLIAFDDIAKAV